MKGPVWINLPCDNLPRAKKFFTEIGFEMNTAHDVPHMLSMFVGQNRVIVNLFSSQHLQNFMVGQPVTDATKSNEVIFSLGAESNEEIDLMAKKVAAAGGTIFAKPDLIDGWMYGFGFTDPDGHRWNGLFMDMSKLPQ